MTNSKLQIYISLDVLLENENYFYAIKNDLTKTNPLLLQAIYQIYKDFNNLVDIIVVCKNKDRDDILEDFIKNLDLKFTYKTLFVDRSDILSLHDPTTKDHVLLDTDDDLLYHWEMKYGKSIKYLDEIHRRSNFEFLEIKNNYKTSEEYYKKLVSYIHLC